MIFNGNPESNKMKEAAMWFVLGMVGLVMLAGVSMAIMWGGRVASDAITTVDVIEPEPGVRCAKMLTAEGAAISCWKVAP